jgi:hypothetical protein
MTEMKGFYSVCVEEFKTLKEEGMAQEAYLLF